MGRLRSAADGVSQLPIHGLPVSLNKPFRRKIANGRMLYKHPNGSPTPAKLSLFWEFDTSLHTKFKLQKMLL